MTEVQYRILEIGAVEIEYDKSYNLVLIAAGNHEADKLSDSLSKGVELNYKYKKWDLYFTLKIYLIGDDKLFLLPIRVEEQNKIIMKWIDENKITSISVTYPMEDSKPAPTESCYMVTF